MKFTSKPFPKNLYSIFEKVINKENQINFLKNEINIFTIEEKLHNPRLNTKIKQVFDKLSLEICNDHPNAFWDRKRHIVKLPYEEEFSNDKLSLEICN